MEIVLQVFSFNLVRDTQKGSFSVADGNMYPLQIGFGGVLVRYLVDVRFYMLSDVDIAITLIGIDYNLK